MSFFEFAMWGGFVSIGAVIVGAAVAVLMERQS